MNRILIASALATALFAAPAFADCAADLASAQEAMKTAKIQPEGDIIFCGNVGEEGLGDLKGVKHIFAQHKEIKAFVGLEPTLGGDEGEPVTYLATGSRRYKISFKGSGGHSYEAFGLPSAIHALGRAGSAFHSDQHREEA